jgi:cellulose synthase (UDP-forming)
VLRREALMQLGLVTYVNDTEEKLKRMLSQLPIDADIGKARLPKKYRSSVEQISQAATEAVDALRRREPWVFVLEAFNSRVDAIRRGMGTTDLSDIALELAALEETERRQNHGGETAVSHVRSAIEQGLHSLTDDMTNLMAPSFASLGLSSDADLLLNMDVGEALDVQPLATISITEDMATAMRLHAIGWKSVFHTGILAKGLAPEDLASALGQRLRWAAGTMQVLLKENPLIKNGLSWPQRLQYFTTMYSYFSGFVSLVYLLAPIIYLFFGVSPVVSFAGDFLWRIIPYLLLNKLIFTFVAWGMEVRRGEQYSLALFPLWIQAVITVFSGEKLTFKVTPKTRQSGVFLNLIKPQLTIIVLLVAGVLYALFSLAVGWRHDTIGVVVNIFWAGYDILMLSVIVKAAVYRNKSA